MNRLIYPVHESLYFHNGVAHIVEHPRGYLRVDWLPTVMFSNALREVYEQLLLGLQNTHFGRVLFDQQFMPAIMPIDQDWLVQDWAPRALRDASYRRCAVIDAHDVYNRLGTSRVLEQLRSYTPLQVAHFPDSLSAESWLMQGA